MGNKKEEKKRGVGCYPGHAVLTESSLMFRELPQSSCRARASREGAPSHERARRTRERGSLRSSGASTVEVPLPRPSPVTRSEEKHRLAQKEEEG